MKRLLVFFTLLSLCFYSCSTERTGNVEEVEVYNEGITIIDGKIEAIAATTEKGATTFYLVRHAEKETGDNPGLTIEGLLRSEKLAKILEDAPLNAIYSTRFNRTIGTVSPSAKLKKLEINSYDPMQQTKLVESLISRKGEHFLIVGHSNTIPGLLNLFQKKKVYKDINESEFDNFYIVKKNSDKDAKILELKF